MSRRGVVGEKGPSHGAERRPPERRRASTALHWASCAGWQTRRRGKRGTEGSRTLRTFPLVLCFSAPQTRKGQLSGIRSVHQRNKHHGLTESPGGSFERPPKYSKTSSPRPGKFTGRGPHSSSTAPRTDLDAPTRPPLPAFLSPLSCP